MLIYFMPDYTQERSGERILAAGYFIRVWIGYDILTAWTEKKLYLRGGNGLAGTIFCGGK